MLDILIAHESGMTRALMRSSLEDAGCLVREAASVQAALDACRTQRPNVALVDTGLGAREGLPLLKRLKADPDLFATAVVLMAEPRSARDALDGLEHGAQDVLLLPPQEVDLLARVRAAARTAELQHEVLSRGRVMEDLVYGDPLTQLHNRRFILGRLDSLVAGARRHERVLSVCMIDIDEFKSINDELGHAAGDAALVAVSGRMANRLRREDDLGRLGGEEFLAILPDTEGAETVRVAEGLREAIGGKPMVLEDRSRRVTASIGWATWDGSEPPEDLVRRADAALYRAKANGRNAVCGPEGGRFERRATPLDAKSPAS